MPVNNYPALAADIAANYPGQTPAQILAAINAMTVSVVGVVPMPVVLIWAAQFGVTAALQALAANSQSALQSAAASVILALQGGYPDLDMSNASVQGLFAGFVSAGVVSSQASAALTGLATSVLPYVQATYGVPALTIDDIYTALRQ